MIKKVASCLIVLCMIFALVGCGVQIADTSDSALVNSASLVASSSLQNPSATSVKSEKSTSVSPSMPNSVSSTKPQVSSGKSSLKSVSKTTSSNSSSASASNSATTETQDTLAVVRLTTETGTDVQSKTEYVGGSWESFDQNGKTDIAKTEIEIRGRGNTTWTFAKKAYRVKFGSAVNPFGMGAGEDKAWVLLANMCDHAVIRNQLGLAFCQGLSNLDFVPSFKPIEVYLNGNYQGVYLLVDAVKVGENRVDITSKKSKVEENGYLIELTKNQADPTAIMIKDSRNIPYEIKSDVGSGDTLGQQKAYITNYLNGCWQAIESKNQSQIESLINVDSVVDAYIAEEVLANMDVGWDSFYMTKDKDDKLEFGPLWDFDVSMGNGNDDSQFAEGLHACASGFVQQNDWFIEFMKFDWFRQKVQTRWKTIGNNLTALSQNVAKFSAAQRTANMRNFAKWSTVSDGKLVKINYENDNILAQTTYDSQIAYLQTWIDARIAWLNDTISSPSFLTVEND